MNNEQPNCKDVTKLALTRAEWRSKGFGIKKRAVPFARVDGNLLWDYNQTYVLITYTPPSRSSRRRYKYYDEDMLDGGIWQDMCDAGYGL